MRFSKGEEAIRLESIRHRTNRRHTAVSILSNVSKECIHERFRAHSTASTISIPNFWSNGDSKNNLSLPLNENFSRRSSSTKEYTPKSRKMSGIEPTDHSKDSSLQSTCPYMNTTSKIMKDTVLNKNTQGAESAIHETIEHTCDDPAFCDIIPYIDNDCLHDNNGEIPSPKNTVEWM